LWAASKLLSVSASVTANQVPAGGTFEVVVTAEVEGDASDLPWPEIQLPAGLSAGARNRSQQSRSQVTIINGSFQSTSTTVVRFHQAVATSKPGVYNVGPLTFQGRNLGTGQISVGAAPGAQTQGPTGSKEVSATTLVTRRKVWVGQQVPFTWRLESSLPLQIASFPDIRSALGKGFYSVIPDSQGQAQAVRSADGRQVARLDWKGTLFPLTPGRQTLPATELKWKTLEGGSVDPFEALARGEDPFEAMRRQPRVREGVTRTEAIALQILPVPTQGRPSGFQGGVGRFRLEAELKDSALRTGSSATLVLRLSGNGQPQASGLPLWQAPPGLEAYPPQDTWKSSWKDGELHTTLERRIVLVPRQEGRFPLDSVRFSWFDPLTERFQTSAVPLPTLAVSPATSGSSGNRPPADSLVGSSSRLTSSDRAWILFGKVSAWAWSLLLLAGLGWGVFRLVASRLSTRSRKQRALRALRARIEQELSRSKPDPGALRRDLAAALALAFGDEAVGWTSREVQEHLASIWTPERAEEFAGLLRDLEASAYAGLALENGKARTDRALDGLATELGR
jgi:hypothetical protein